ncbi:MAG: DUF308 domain-containing protein [Clostridia bacterium]|nr:DUF308 domain-containing protein [Clostridia bacterium]
MKMRSTGLMSTAKIGYIVMSAVFCVAGLAFIIRPDISAAFLGYLLGAAMVVFGAIKIIGYCSKDLYRLAFQYDLEFGIILIVIGAIILLKPFDALNLIFIATGIATLADSLFKVRIARDAKNFGISTWWVILAFAILAGLIGIILVIRPLESAKILTVILGISMLFDGALNLCVAISTVKIIKNQYPDVIEAEFYETEADNK